MDKRVNICDDCEKQIAQHKCANCGKDVCKTCAHTFKIAPRGNNSATIGFDGIVDDELNGSTPVCKDCAIKLTLAIYKNKEQLFRVLKEATIEEKI